MPVRSLVVALAALITVSLTATLGFWQLSRAAEKQALETLIEARSSMPLWDEAGLLGASDLSTNYHRPVRLVGEWVPEATVFLDNRPMGGRSGFIVVTPLRLNAPGQSVLVQRGWVQRDFTDRTRVPAIPSPAGRVTVEGRLATPPSQLFELGAAQSGPIRQNIDLAAFSRETGLDLVNGSVLQSAPSEALFQRDWPRFAAGVQKHYGYAFQWFAMSATTLALYVWFQLISPRRKHRPHGTEI